MMSLSVDCCEDQKVFFFYFVSKKKLCEKVLFVGIFVLLEGLNPDSSV